MCSVDDELVTRALSDRRSSWPVITAGKYSYGRGTDGASIAMLYIVMRYSQERQVLMMCDSFVLIGR